MRIEYVAAPRGADIDPNWAPVEVEVEVTRSWLGRSDQRMVLLTGLGGGDCGYPFSIGADYVILLRETESGAWYASICQGIQSVRSAGSTISALGRGYRPSVFPVDTVRPSRPLKLAPFAVGYSVLAGLALLGLTRHLYRTRVE